jgi:5-methylcytosine-specific restriction protein A
MPTAPKRLCCHPGCGVLVVEGRCPEHQKVSQAADRARRGSSSERGYDGRWQDYRPVFFLEFPLCGNVRSDAYRARVGPNRAPR